MIGLSLTKKQARKLLKAITNASVTDTDVADIYNHINEQLIEDDKRVAELPPWRKVVEDAKPQGVYWYETLECGHRYQLKQTRNSLEDGAKKRRCKQCKEQGCT